MIKISLAIVVVIFIGIYGYNTFTQPPLISLCYREVSERLNSTKTIWAGGGKSKSVILGDGVYVPYTLYSSRNDNRGREVEAVCRFGPGPDDMKEETMIAALNQEPIMVFDFRDIVIPFNSGAKAYSSEDLTRKFNDAKRRKAVETGALKLYIVGWRNKDPQKSMRLNSVPLGPDKLEVVKAEVKLLFQEPQL